MTKTIKNRTRLALIWVAYLGLAFRAFIPVGYMPAPLSEGGPFVPCPGGLAGRIFENSGGQHTGHHLDHGDSGSGEHIDWEFCPVGTVLDSFALTADIGLQTLTITHIDSPTELASVVAIQPAITFQARAPPSIYSLDV